MPADIMKPGFIIVTAWFLAKMHDTFGDNIFLNRAAWRFKWMSWWPYLITFAIALGIIFQHPDLGTAILYLAVLGAMLLIAGLPLIFIPGIVLAGVGLLTVAFFTMSHVHNRIVAFFTGTGDTYQVTQSIQSIQNGGLLGQGDGAFVKQSLPDAHTDFIFAAIAEDAGAIVACGLIIFLMLVIRRLVVDATNARDKFGFYALGECVEAIYSLVTTKFAVIIMKYFASSNTISGHQNSLCIKTIISRRLYYWRSDKKWILP